MKYQKMQDISQVILAYATAIDNRDWALFRQCFTNELMADYGDFGCWQTLDQFAGFMEQIHRDLGATMHRISNIVVSLDVETAQAKSYVDAVLMPGGSGGQPHRAMGYYDDELVTVDGCWKIKRRIFTLVYSSSNLDG